MTLIWKKENIVWKEKKDVQEVIEMVLIHSNVCKFFKKHTNTLYCFSNRRSLDKSSDSMDEKFLSFAEYPQHWNFRYFYVTALPI